ncbi:MAG: 16S rRNA (adenine(1518)-N(6)/adenine(1519)-N(6))-dimethyltransferase RsmA [Gammaproteobacteria bacterium]
MSHRPRKRFGQHFLHDPQVIARIVDAISPRPEEHVVEIGPGRGALTRPLMRRLGAMEVVELDREVIPLLEQACAGLGELTVHSTDALKFDFSTLAAAADGLRLVGNLPYNISTPLLFHLLAQDTAIRDMHFMLQKEVVTRMAAVPGNRDYGRLTVMLAARCQVQHLFDIGPGAFTPPPRVQSSFVRLTPWPDAPFPDADPALYARVVTQAFSMRRKTLRNSLKPIMDAEAILEADCDPGARAETLDPADFANLAVVLETLEK